VLRDPDDLKRLVDAAHARHLMLFADVVFNHLGPEGNYLHRYAPDFFTSRHRTPWGEAIDLAQPCVRAFFIQCALYWLEEFRFDGLRLDAVHAFPADARESFLAELADAVQGGPGRQRQVHLVLENDDNRAALLAPDGPFDAQWNDDAHHAMHVLATGERDGYYADYFPRTRARLGRALASGFVYQGEPAPARGRRRGEPSDHLLATRFIAFLQNHAQVGNRACGERLHQLAPSERVRALTEVLLLAPWIPLLFMGEDWLADAPFPFFCDYSGELAEAVTEGRQREFARFTAFAKRASQSCIPDPCASTTFLSARLDRGERTRSINASHQALVTHLLAVRRRELVPRLPTLVPGGRSTVVGRTGLRVTWRFSGGALWMLQGNLGDSPITMAAEESLRVVHATVGADGRTLPPWTVRWLVSDH